MFTLRQSSETRGDCTADYAVELDKDYTVGEFVQAVLKNRPDEWGRIAIKTGPIIFAAFSTVKCEYRDGKLLSDLPDDMLGKKVVFVKADGGWSSMDYLLTIE